MPACRHLKSMQKDWIGTTEVKIAQPTVVSIGKFDGEHMGHQKIFETMREISEKEGYATAVFTFGTPPAAVVEGSDNAQINTNAERRKRLHEAGIEYIVEYPFTPEIASMSGERFVKEVLLSKMNMKAVVAGPDCAFGKAKSGNAALLRKLGPELGFRPVIIEKRKDGDRDISSTYIREELRNGNIRKANELLGAVYSIEGTVTHGNRIGGSRLGFPTVNLMVPAGKLLPRFGVYATTVELPDGREYRGITNVGDNPTVEGDRLGHIARIETFLIDFSGDLYDKTVTVRFRDFLRPEKKFADLDALKAQIAKDIAAMNHMRDCQDDADGR